MTVDAPSAVGTQSNTQQTATKQTQTLDYDAFLMLLTAQMQYQDPTKPMDSTQFVSQLASFSGVEQAVKTNQKLDSLLVSQALGQVDDLIGKYVTSMDGKITGKVKEVHIYSNGTVVALEDGKELLLDAGVKISETPPEEEAPAA
ncbi:MAG: flagellar hook assembly protein FlgD [Hyphomicrobium sp.]|uniref:flagellar hook assembly protein FlgD n=1 Tax=Hyphomicrobium sp. TaxID=82 RepID=UPI003D0A3C59